LIELEEPVKSLKLVVSKVSTSDVWGLLFKLQYLVLLLILELIDGCLVNLTSDETASTL
jgi:hypothetical protein